MSEDNKKKLSEQLIRCILDDKLSTDKKLKKMDYIIKMGADVNIKNEFGCSVLNIAKFIGDEKTVSFLEEKGAKETGLDREKTEEFGQASYRRIAEEWNDKVAAERLFALCEGIVSGNIVSPVSGPCSLAPVIKPGKGYNYMKRNI